MLTQLSAPESYPVSLADVKEHLKVEHSDEDDLITSYIATATSICEVRTGRAFVEQTWKYHLSEFPDSKLYLPKPPLMSVTHIKYYDAENSQQTWSADNYHVVTGTKGQGWIEPISTTTYPTTYTRPDSIEIQFVCGYETQPPQAEHLIKLIVGGFYEEREGQSYNTIKDNPAVERLANQLRVGEYV